MTGFSLKPQFTGNPNVNSNTPQVDWNAINKQVKTDNHLAIISLMVDLGVHTPELSANLDKSTTLATQAEVDEFVEQVKSLLPKNQVDKVKVTTVDGSFVVNAQVRQSKDRQEVAIFADLVDAIVDYGSEIGQKPYRVLLNKSYKGDIRGLGLTQVPPIKQGGVWTFPPASLLTELATVTKQTVMIDGTDKTKLNDVGLLLGQALMVDVKADPSESGSVFVNVKGVGSVPSMLEKHIDYSLVSPVGITFENATAELLRAAGIRGSVIKKIKAANNYKDSNMEKAIKAFEGANVTEVLNEVVAEKKAKAAVDTTKPVTPNPVDLEADCPF